MKKFQFRLERVLQLKLHNEKEKQKKLAEAAQKVFNQQEKLAGLVTDRHINQKEQRQCLLGKIDRSLMSNYSRYYLHLKKEEMMGTEMLNALKRAQEKKRLDLIEATREKKSYEKLKERKKEKYHKEAELNLQKEQDEIASQMLLHKKRLPA
ncbi:MAG: flagellar FliJ family protein [Candidatus Zixiibacteriota bacterium]